ncbi:MAG: hypothetical protein JJU34_03430 [Lunatimonas sp.]|uniref:hypothetical protein n=1 Tax=Lunatimonas sp. TaxID=2060141 RepID=UPI00263AA98C|nr:hypothetical protein [Lunatimonas sp.]MCC5936314.1 hypothetical protein [Lunatimonas sp.]
MHVLTRISRFLITLSKWLLLIVFLATAYYLTPSLWNRWVVYPRLDREIEALKQQYRQPPQIISLPSYQGALHAHTYWSHDSRGVLDEILPAAKEAKLDFVFFSDHKRHALDSFPRSIRGFHDGILFEPGTESNLLMVSPLRETVLDWGSHQDSLIKEITENGGLVLYLHTEQDHDWGNPHYQGMEIYNIHTDLLDEKGLFPFLLNSAVNGRNHKHWTYREIFDEQTDILALWDSLNQHRKIIGYGAPDVHNNQSLRARYLEDGNVEWVGPNAKTIRVATPGWKEKWLLGEPDLAGWSFKWELDTYFHSFKYVQTHVFAQELSSRAIKEGLEAGNAFVSFESLLEATGFQYVAVGKDLGIAGIMGDSIPLGQVSQLRAVSPYPVHFQLVKNGELIDSSESSYQYEQSISEPGNYRIVCRITLNGNSVPWVYTNPLYVY